MHFKEWPSSPTRGLLLALLALAVLAAGCGDLENNDQSSTTAPVAASGDPTGTLTWSNWPLYIDPGKNGTLANFEQDTGVKVDYVEDINDNQAFFAKLQPTLAEGDSEGRSLITVSDWLAAKMYDLGYLQRIDPSAVPNVEKNLIPALRHPSADPERDFTVPWQSGMTGIIVNKDLAPDIDSISDLFDPRYKGHITMLTELRDTVPMTLKSMGIDPDTATPEQWMAAVDKIKAAADSGQIRKFTGNDYIRELASGDAWASLGWSGDAVQLQADNPNIEFVMPKEGCMLWSTSLEIPVGAPNPEAAQALMNYVYDPKVQADIAEWVNYVTPVKGVKAIVRKRDPELADNQLIFPSASYTKNCTFEPVLGGQLGDDVTKAFEAVLTG
ncbi:MAG TPA: spermidine/putrescine ABC transporter substrate-binding protein [Solirubrobacterales bacterium]|jgi:spermidine/putrescine transport system substrate-binding protein|nr:spermidine/putrescine ABC transporter substrate-binding protein [Solirubrobacterales bacterium]